jgi:hypothetical protein
VSHQRNVVATTLNDLVEQWRARYGVPVAHFDVDADGHHVSGAVLTRDQAAEVALRLVDHGVSVNLGILEDRSEPAPGGALMPAVPVVALYRTPALARLTTEVLAGDGPLRALDKEGDALLVQGDDDTLGWARATELAASDREAAEASIVLPDGELVGAQPGWLGALEAAGQTFVDAGVPYVLGGRSEARIDCSGLVSLVVRRTAGAVLPRHSMDQKRCGERVARGDRRPGDLVFARLGETNVAHVGILLGGPAGLTVLHASQRAGKVVREPEESFLAGYRFMGVRRLFAEA